MAVYRCRRTEVFCERIFPAHEPLEITGTNFLDLQYKLVSRLNLFVQDRLDETTNECS